MPLPGTVVAAPVGVHGFDANSVLNRGICEVAKARGFEFCIRYVSRQDVQPTGDLSEAEANVILSAGLALMPVQHVAPQNWSPSQALGIRNGKNAAKHASQIGFPEGVNVWLDLEGAKASTPHEAMIAYCNAWFAEVEGAGFVPGVYVGARAILTGNELFWRLTTKHYWKSGSRFPDIPHRGYQLIQSIIRNDKIDVLQSIAISPRTKTSAAPFCGYPRVDRLTTHKHWGSGRLSFVRLLSLLLRTRRLRCRKQLPQND